MSEYKSNICPCCPKGCDLSAPRCPRGEEFLKTGTIPEGKGHRHGNYEEMSLDEKILALLGRLSHMSHGSRDGKSSQTRILRILRKHGAMTQRELTEQLDIRPGSASEILKKLETSGWITRRSNPKDRRTVDIALSDAGTAHLNENDANSPDAGRSPLSCLTEEEKQQLLALLEKIAKDWHSRFRGEGHGKHGGHGKGGHGHHHKHHDFDHHE